MSGDRVAVLLDVKEKTGSEVDKEEKEGEQPANPPVYWILGTIYSGSFEFSSSSVDTCPKFLQTSECCEQKTE